MTIYRKDRRGRKGPHSQTKDLAANKRKRTRMEQSRSFGFPFDKLRAADSRYAHARKTSQVVKEQDRATNKYEPAAPGGKTHIRRMEGEESIGNICFVFNGL